MPLCCIPCDGFGTQVIIYLVVPHFLQEKTGSHLSCGIVIPHTGIGIRINTKMNVIEILPLLLSNIAHVNILVLEIGAYNIGNGN